MTIWKMPVWLRKLLHGTWFGYAGIVGEGTDVQPGSVEEQALAEHEEEHIEQQEEEVEKVKAISRPLLKDNFIGRAVSQVVGNVIWLGKYVASRRFRLLEESRAMAKELTRRPESQHEIVMELFAEDLASSSYLWAARSVAEAEAAIKQARADLAAGLFK